MSLRKHEIIAQGHRAGKWWPGILSRLENPDTPTGEGVFQVVLTSKVVPRLPEFLIALS